MLATAVSASHVASAPRHKGKVAAKDHGADLKLHYNIALQHLRAINRRVAAFATAGQHYSQKAYVLRGAGGGSESAWSK